MGIKKFFEKFDKKNFDEKFRWINLRTITKTFYKMVFYKNSSHPKYIIKKKKNIIIIFNLSSKMNQVLLNPEENQDNIDLGFFPF